MAVTPGAWAREFRAAGGAVNQLISFKHFDDRAAGAHEPARALDDQYLAGYVALLEARLGRVLEHQDNRVGAIESVVVNRTVFGGWGGRGTRRTVLLAYRRA